MSQLRWEHTEARGQQADVNFAALSASDMSAQELHQIICGEVTVRSGPLQLGHNLRFHRVQRLAKVPLGGGRFAVGEFRISGGA